MRTTRSKSRNRTKRAARQYTIRAVPADVDQSLRRIARERGVSLNSVLLDAIRQAAGTPRGAANGGNLSKYFGCLPPDPDLDRALEEMRVIDEDMWR